MLNQLKKDVFDANMDLKAKGVVIYTWGNVSGIDREKGLIVIKPSGVDYDTMKADDMVVVDLKSGDVVEGHYKPSSDTPTHLALYRQYQEIGGIVHTHSTVAVAFAQAGMPIKAFGTTHADYFYGDVPCTRNLTKEDIECDYERNTGNVIIETIGENDPMAIPGILVKSHGPFAWGKTPAEAVYHAVVLEKVAEMALATLTIKPDCPRESQYILDKHYYRKHGANAYYGQENQGH